MVDIVDKLKNGTNTEKGVIICVGCLGILFIFAMFGAFIGGGDTSSTVSTPATLGPTPINKYQPGDVISVYDTATVFPYGWVITRYESDEDLYYGIKVENRDGVWGLTETKEYDLWSKDKTEQDFPYVLGHMDLQGPEDTWSQPIYSTPATAVSTAAPTPKPDTTTMGERNAAQKALEYLRFMPFSYSGLVEQLEYEGFTNKEAVYGVDHCGADWNKQAALKAQDYLDFSSFSREGLIEQLIYEGFTRQQAEYGVKAVGY